MKLHPLRKTKAFGYTTFGCMWRQGECTGGTRYLCRRTADGGEVPLQSRVTAYWPDGTVKWTAHTADAALLGAEFEVLPDAALLGAEFEVLPDTASPERGRGIQRDAVAPERGTGVQPDTASPEVGRGIQRDAVVPEVEAGASPDAALPEVEAGVRRDTVSPDAASGAEPGRQRGVSQGGTACAAAEGMTCEETSEEILLRAGVITIRIAKDGRHLFTSAERDGKPYLCGAEAVLILEEPLCTEGNPARMEKHYVGSIGKISVEESGNLKTIIRYDGIHKSASGEEKLPFIIRMEAGYNNPNLKFTHTFLYDGDEDKDFLKGLGIRFHAPMAGELYNRHVKFMGDHGVFHETLVPLTAWRPRIPVQLYQRQMAGERLALAGEERELADKMLQDVPFWSEYVLCQDSVSHFGIRKKLREENLCYIDSLHGNRTAGGGAFGSEYGCVTVAVRDFWEKYPSGITFRNLDGDRAECTLWFWAPEAPAMDFRHYASRGYNQVCYEGYDYKGATADGIACTNECSVTFSDRMIPTDEEMEEFTALVNDPPVYVGTPEFYHDRRAFGYWSLPLPEGEATETERWLEGQLEQAFAFYKEEIEQRNWYGMFNYGDVMHTYDAVRHQWKYDIGGYAWDNTELVPTLWLWLYFMRTGREDVFRVAEKLSRHASEVDVYHMGKYKGLGSRHNVRHWGCPCKEARIAMAGHHRYLYYLTGDRRLEDIFEELKDNERSFLNKDPLGDFYDKKDMVYPSHARSGPDWSSLCSNWMTRWERFGDERYKDKILTGISDIKSAPLKLVSGPDFEFDPATCHLRYIGERTTGGCHLQICMGAPQIWTELGDLLGDEEWKRMMADLGRIYFMTKEERDEATGGLTGKRQFTFPIMAAGIGAYGAAYLRDETLAGRVWRELLCSVIKENDREGFARKTAPNQGNREELREIPWVSTNFVAQFCLNVIMALEFIRDSIPETMEAAGALVGEGEGNFRKA